MMDLPATDTTGSDTMTAAKLIEYRITRQLLQRRDRRIVQRNHNLWADRLIAVLAVTAGLFIIGSYFEELLWAVLAAATVTTLR
jgi:hypothetical protein